MPEFLQLQVGAGPTCSPGTLQLDKAAAAQHARRNGVTCTGAAQPLIGALGDRSWQTFRPAAVNDDPARAPCCDFKPAPITFIDDVYLHSE
ncbi:hypothetical protein ACCO45_007768 [Purpureocillium lilacinum]|uniref:Uncharacterized protein n=1 Tax=Purpureocillium lilacinum TaxID=33203 RepID=A0ACC4DLE4_PURLI